MLYNESTHGCQKGTAKNLIEQRLFLPQEYYGHKHRPSWTEQEEEQLRLQNARDQIAVRVLQVCKISQVEGACCQVGYGFSEEKW